MAFIQTGEQALWAAVLIGLMGGLANVACIDMAIRACPPGLQGTMMMMIGAAFAISSRGGDVFGAWVYGLSPKYGFTYCVIAITVTYALILPVIPFIPKQITATVDGEPNPQCFRRRRLRDYSDALPRRSSRSRRCKYRDSR